MSRPLVIVHIIAGAIALTSMWLPLLTRKGSRLHRRAGWVFVSCIGILVTTGIVLSSMRLLFDRTPNGRLSGAFLLWISVVNLSAVIAGVRAVHVKVRTTRSTWWEIALSALVLLSSAGIGAYGVLTGMVLMQIFAPLGLLAGYAGLRKRLRASSSPMEWWTDHMQGMLTCSVATLTAFTVNNGGRIGIGSLASWVAPIAIGVPLTRLWIAYYRRQFALRATTPLAAPESDRSGSRVPPAPDQRRPIRSAATAPSIRQ